MSPHPPGHLEPHDEQDQIHSDPSDGVRYIETNLATPPFDDQNARIALNYAVDREGFRQLAAVRSSASSWATSW